MKIAFRVDASSKIGLGHLKRCLSLAEELRDLGAEVLFIVGSSEANIEALLDERRFSFRTLQHGGTVWEVDAQETVVALMSWTPDWIVVDHYSLDARWHANVGTGLSVEIAAIEDLADRRLNVSLLIDHNLGVDPRSKYAGLLPGHARVLGGPRFALLGLAFRTPRYYKFHSKVRSIGVFMGGGDADDLSSMVVMACRKIADFTGPMEIATTRYNPNLAGLRRLAQRWPQTEVLEDLADLADFFARHDLQVGAGGGAALERTAVGAPSLLLVAADNQREVVSEFKKAGIASGLAEGEGLTVEGIGRAVGELIGDVQARRAHCERAPTIVDGLGARRVALHLLRNQMQVSGATIADAEMILAWRNHSSVRLMSRDSASIDLATHIRWMKAVIADEDRVLLIGYVGEVAVGVIRFDKLGLNCMEVSLYINPAFQGIGLGSLILQRGEEHLASKFRRDLKLVATVMDANESSRRLFESNGYRFVESRWEKRQI